MTCPAIPAIAILFAACTLAACPPTCAHAAPSTARALQSVCGHRGPALAPIVDQAARQRHLDPLLLVAVIRAESRCDPNAVGRLGEIGLMQVKPGTRAARGEVDRLRDPRVNVNLGARHLAWALGFCGDLAGGLSLYRGIKGCRDSKGSRRVMQIWNEISKGARI